MFGSLGPPEFILLGSFGIVAFIASIFWIWMLIVAATREKNSTDKVVWVLIILFTHVLGAAIYYFVRYAKTR